MKVVYTRDAVPHKICGVTSSQVTLCLRRHKLVQAEVVHIMMYTKYSLATNGGVLRN
jgi:hypothetical protein